MCSIASSERGDCPGPANGLPARRSQLRPSRVHTTPDRLCYEERSSFRRTGSRKRRTAAERAVSWYRAQPSEEQRHSDTVTRWGDSSSCSGSTTKPSRYPGALGRGPEQCGLSGGARRARRPAGRPGRGPAHKPGARRPVADIVLVPHVLPRADRSRARRPRPRGELLRDAIAMARWIRGSTWMLPAFAGLHGYPPFDR